MRLMCPSQSPGNVILRIFGIFNDVVYLVKHGPTHIESSARLFVASYLPEIGKVD